MATWYLNTFYYFTLGYVLYGPIFGVHIAETIKNP